MPFLALLLLFVQDPASDLGLELSDVRPVESALAPERAKSLARHVGRPEAFLANLTLLRARGAGPVDTTPGEWLVASLPLPAPLDGARLTCAVRASGRLAHATLRGRPELDDDLGWALFLGQMCDYGALGPENELVPTPEGTAGPASFDSWRAERRAGQDADLIDALLGQRAAMRGLTLLQRRLILGEGPLEDAWLGAAGVQLDGLEQRSGVLELVLGPDGLADYRRELTGLRTRLGALALLDPGDLPARARRMCGSCHSHDAPDGGDWTEALSALRTELEFPLGVFRVGYDLAPVPGDDGTRSQLVADGVRAVLLAARSL